MKYPPVVNLFKLPYHVRKMLPIIFTVPLQGQRISDQGGVRRPIQGEYIRTTLWEYATVKHKTTLYW